MKPTTTTLLALASLGTIAQGAISQWETASQGIASNVTTSTNGGAGYVLDGTTGVAYDYGDLSNGNTTDIGPGNAVEFIFNASDSGASVILGSLNGWNNVENYNFKLEQWNNSGVFGVTAQGVADASYTGISSIFNTDTHVVFVNRTDNKMELYINGVSQGVSTRNGNWVTNGGVGVIGGQKDAPTIDTLTGTVYGVASYNSQLTAGNVTTLYNAWVNVPEPSSAALIGLGGLAFSLRRRK